ncbi:hypothetical protein CHH67_21345 [Paenibacillus campinasensis]|uniref:Uncharacterized protein n=1 Tax=Paenibacillus campinasensis TaxID=66347 RepID=A0A268EIB1_9BACL|nr:hypothetical protein CHH67_21345 [Paenibacillus campinasensis]
MFEVIWNLSGLVLFLGLVTLGLYNAFATEEEVVEDTVIVREVVKTKSCHFIYADYRPDDVKLYGKL